MTLYELKHYNNEGDTLYFGRYPQNTKDPEVLEPIKWRVLQKATDGSKALLVSDKTLDFKHYHNTAGSITWANCDLRHWLNNSFYNKAFTTTEKSSIKKKLYHLVVQWIQKIMYFCYH